MRNACVAAAVAVVMCATALATPVIDSAIVKSRLWNDADYSTFTSGNLYPSTVWMNDANMDDYGWANRHNFRLSSNGGISDAVFLNGDGFVFSADVTLTGTANSEGGISLSPWWSQDFDGVFMLNAETGEVAIFGGRLPFYSFTAAQGITYTKGDTVRQTIAYNPNSLTDLDPATIEYKYQIGASVYTSGPIAFDEGNPLEGYGSWGALDDARVGGYFLPKVNNTIPGNWGQINFDNMTFVPEPASVVLLGLAGLALVRRR